MRTILKGFADYFSMCTPRAPRAPAKTRRRIPVRCSRSTAHDRPAALSRCDLTRYAARSRNIYQERAYRCRIDSRNASISSEHVLLLFLVCGCGWASVRVSRPAAPPLFSTWFSEHAEKPTCWSTNRMNTISGVLHVF